MSDDPIDIDRAALRARYRLEREKRLRADGNEQYLEPTGRFASLLEDPYVAPSARPPRSDEVEVAVIGGGFAGLATGAMLRQQGIDDLVILEAGGDLGGVWYWNRYPGAMCDTAAMIYLPLLEETGALPSAKYVGAPEIHAHALRIAEHYDLRARSLLSTKVTAVVWEEGASRWRIETDRGDALRARFVTMGTGPLHRPKLPGIPGIDRFAGPCFHTSRWDWAATGGDPLGAPMTGLADKRVGIVGTGATAVQCIPPLGRDAAELFVFQRTPSSVDVERTGPSTRGWRPRSSPAGRRRGCATSPSSRPGATPRSTSSRTAGPTSRSGSGPRWPNAWALSSTSPWSARPTRRRMTRR